MKCAVITPLGPGHESLVRDCESSINRATSLNHGPFKEIVHLVIDDTRGLYGRSRARNKGVQTALAHGFEWLFFLDADDIMAPNAFAAIQELHDGLDGIWGNIAQISPGQSQPSLRDPQVTLMNSLEELLLNDPYRTLQMGHFVRTEVAAQYPFDETMDTGEDFHYYLRMWENERCAKIDKVFFINRRGQHSTGPRSADGRQWREAVTRLIAECRIRNGDSQKGRHDLVAATTQAC